VEILGRIEDLKVGDGFGHLTVRERGTNELEIFIIFNVLVVPEHRDLSAFDWIRFSMQVSLAREALARGLEVRVVTREDTAVISTLELHAPTGP
jgi:hypothetical protein